MERPLLRARQEWSAPPREDVGDSSAHFHDERHCEACHCASRGAAVSAALLLATLSCAHAQTQAPAQWPTPARDAANTRFSPLTDINVGNVAGVLRALIALAPSPW